MDVSLLSLAGKSIACFCAASVSIGGGHLTRCFALSQELKDFGAEITFFCDGYTESLLRKLVNEELDITFNHILDINKFEVRAEKFDVLILDFPAISDAYLSEMRKACRILVVVSDIPKTFKNVDLVIDQTLHRKKSDYRGLIAGNTKLLLGSKFAMINRKFRSRREEARSRTRKSLDRLFVSMGASYTVPLEDKIIEAISGSDFRGELVFLSWDATKGRAELISQKMKKSCTSVEVLNATKTVEDYLCWCDLAIGAGGMSSWERCCLSVPSILTVISDNQLDNAIALSDLGAAHIFDWRTSINTQGLTESINSFIAESESLQLMGNSACAIVDGFGPRRIAEEFFRAIEKLDKMV
ncbi:UDP-2,4-diacetamido-2,4,6-trideoxy-beta-L-altropyranose hydrolase [SAR116 cluster bacterium]|nr:UDP-2,4-diacetamido-2,4,6-trideoxy-beta-L-altropyranose hydrolase [SAR116 cluster bacterium]